MPLDTRTIIFLTSLGSGLLGVAFWLVSRAYAETIRGVPRWALGCCVQSVAWALFGWRDIIPNFWTIVVANFLLILSLCLQAHALREFTGGRVERWPYALSGVAFAVLAVLTYLWPNFTLRSIFVYFVCAILFVYCARLTAGAQIETQVSSTPKSSATHQALPLSYRVTSGGFWICSVFSLLRIAIVSQGSQHEDIFAPNLLQQGFSVLIYIAVIMVTCSFLLMCSDKFHHELQHLARRDLLTGALNRGTIEMLLDKEISRSKRTNQPLSVLLLDMDAFKNINDTHGHTIGDEVLIGCVQSMNAQVRQGDLVGRFGGEEFLIVLPNTDENLARSVAERLREAIASSVLAPSLPQLRGTASIGLARLQSQQDELISLVQRADTALYRAKDQGRNRVVVWEIPPLKV